MGVFDWVVLLGKDCSTGEGDEVVVGVVNVTDESGIKVGGAIEVGVATEGCSGMLSTFGKELKRFSLLSGLFFKSVGIENLFNRKLGSIF